MEMEKTGMKCQLGYDPEQGKGSCTKEECETCRWNPKEAERRRRLLEQKGLTELEDGTRRLMIKKKKKAEPAKTPQKKKPARKARSRAK